METEQAYDTDRLPGRLLFRFSVGIVNLGPGEFLLEGQSDMVLENGNWDVNQVVFNDDDSRTERDAGTFTYNPVTTRMEVNGWISYEIRRVLANDEVGEVLRTGAKTVVNITSSAQFPGQVDFPRTPIGERITGQSPTHGISVGWYDDYSLTLDQQWVDVTGLPQGEYWLRAEIDPFDQLEETDETDNVTIIKVTLEDENMPQMQGDLDRDNVVNAVDVQTVINAALGLPISVLSADVNGDGTVNAVDVQVLINAALGLLTDPV